MKKVLLLYLLLLVVSISFSQVARVTYNPCVLMDSVDKRLEFIRLNALRIFTDTADCKQQLFDSIAVAYIQSGNVKYLDMLSSLHNSSAYNKVEDLYTDVIRILVTDNFSGFLAQLYSAKGKYLPLEKELVVAMNMIIDGRPYKQKYMGLLNVEISKARDKKDTNYALYLEKLKLKIEGDTH